MLILFVLYCFLFLSIHHGVHATNPKNPGKILVVGSMNADTFLPVARLPREGENILLVPGKTPVVDLPGGKGCTQAVAASKLLPGRVAFVGQFGNDAAASLLKQALLEAKVEIPPICQQPHPDLPSGRGYVFLAESGSVSAVISGGSNQDGWTKWDNNDGCSISQQEMDDLLNNVRCIMLQREVPEFVNLRMAQEAQKRGGIVVLQDIGGEERGMTSEMMQACDYLIPNESELRRLVHPYLLQQQNQHDNPAEESDQPLTSEQVVQWAQLLQQQGARNVLVTRGSRGSTLVTETGQILHQPALALQPQQVVDETGAGDCYRAAFAVALLEGQSLQRCMEFASAAGCCSVQTQGAVPSTPTRSLVEECYQKIRTRDSVLNIPRGDGQASSNVSSMRGGGQGQEEEPETFPFLIGSRLNSMKDRPELWTQGPLQNPRDYVLRQAQVKGLTCVDFNYPQHFGKDVWKDMAHIKKTLEENGLVAGAVCLRYPAKFARGAMNHPDEKLRREAIDLTKEAAQVALDLGCNEVVVWSAYDGYDYPFQVDYDDKWDELVWAFQECCDAFPNVKFSLEYKPTDENTRFFTVPSTGAAMMFVQEVDRPNMGLTLDVGHMLMSGENPAQSIAMAGRKQKLFGIQLNDGYTRLAAEDGMMFGSIHPSMALEIMYQLRRTNFQGHLYFDTFPQRTDPIKEAEYNIRRVKAFWAAAGAIDDKRLKRATGAHDAIEALEIVNDALRST